MNKIPTALRLASSLIWAITPEYLAIIEDIAAGNSDLHAVEQQLGRPLQNTRTVENRDGVAIIPVESVIFRRASMFDAVSGNVASVQTIALDFTTALADPAVRAIVLNIDSPGGEVNGISELANIIYRARGVKPIKAYVGDMAGSAAYWLACSCDEIIPYKTATVGSIGVMAIADIAKNPNQRRFISSQSPNKNAPADTSRGEKLIQDEVDKTAQIFYQEVAAFRGIDLQTALDDFGKGAMVMADEAVAAGMADRLGTFEDLITELQQAGKPVALGAFAVNEEVVAKFSSGIATTLRAEETEKESEDMNKEIVSKMLAGLSETERAEVLASLNGTETTAVATPAPAVSVPVQQPAQAAVESPAIVLAPPGVDIAALQAQLATERAARIGSDCDSFITSMKAAGKVTPVEEADVRPLFISLAGMADPSALNQYKASIQARPTSPMLQEVVASGQLKVLGNGTTDTRTEAEKDADAVNALLASTEDGKAAAKALKAGEIEPAFKQFAISH